MGLTPELRKAIEAKSVERQIDDPEFCGVNKGEHLAFIAGAEACFEIMQAERKVAVQDLLDMQAENQRLRTALQNWVSWEEQQIQKEGPYVGREINALIDQARAALKDPGGV